MNSQNTGKDMVSLIGKDSDLGSKLILEIIDIGVPFSSLLHREVMNLVSLRSHYLNIRNNGLDKDKIDKDLRFRKNTLKRVLIQMKRDQNPYNFTQDDFIKRQIFLALLETALLARERMLKINVGDMQSLNFHLWKLNQILTAHEIPKPTNTLEVLLKKCGYWKGLGASLGVRTIRNKVSLASQLIDEAKRKGACHLPAAIPEWPKWQSEEFARGMAKGCPQCNKAWTKTLAVKASRKSAWRLGAMALKKELPDWSAQIKFMDEYVDSEGENAIPLKELHDYLPLKYRDSFLHLFKA